MSEQTEVREPVKWFAEQMEKQLQANDHKSGWDAENCSMVYLFEQMDSKFRRFAYNHACGNVSTHLITELIDIANYAMMQADQLREGSESSE